ncbi:sulfotransferase family 2 domain-containing protein [Vibrio nitrifigilis]|uniref:Sulfotransferase family 2 domain-containing protein n=1 Tax=Vibrio nitrifigilis TaxID=2789781 RepID=A0ABS0GG75_9VIBR|nr:sulfotransferase family 2 domain-containing protein [Vibrio nitrifigilis]MBF9001208.1 sulfotransferase family 2 domain-containing protein [Vibrio nitrifigilis]
MKKSITLVALRFISKNKQQVLVSRALNYLLEDADIGSYVSTVVQIKIRDTKHTWSLQCNGKKFEPSNNISDVIVTISLDDVINFPSQTQLKTKLKNREIDVQGAKVYQNLVSDLLENVDQVKITACIRRLRKMMGLTDRHIQDKEPDALTIRDIGSEKDVDYIRDLALRLETTTPELSYKLMVLAHGARPKGPFIKRKLDEYRQRGYDRIALVSGKEQLQAIEINNSIGYFPIPKTACSSVKMALYKLKNECEYNKDDHDGIHVHDYWTRRLVPLNHFPQKIIIIRDPIERFLSAFGSRVYDHGELNRGAIERDCPWLLKKLPFFRPNISQFIEHLDKYMLVPVIEHHCKPLSWHVKNDLTKFTHVFPMNRIDDFERFLHEATGEYVSIPKSHVGKNKVPLASLSRSELNKLFDFFEDDYRLLSSWYSKEMLLNKWSKNNQDKVLY